MTEPAIPDEESLFPRPAACPKDWRHKPDPKKPEVPAEKPEAPKPESKRPEPKKPASEKVPAARKAPSAPSVIAAPPEFVGDRTHRPPTAPPTASPRRSGVARNLLRAAAVFGAVGGIALLAQDRRSSAPRTSAPVEVAVARPVAPATPVVALEKPAAVETAKPVIEKPAPEASAPAAPSVAEKRPVSTAKKSLRELAKRSRHHEAIARILLELDPTHPDENATLQVTYELTALGAPAVPALREMVVEIDEESDRRVLAAALAGIKDESAAEAAGEALALVEDQPAQVSILRALPETPACSEAIAAAFAVEPNNETRMLMLKEYTRRIAMNPDEAPPELPVEVSEFDVDAFLRVAAADKDAAIRRETLRMVEERGAPRDMHLAEDVYKSATDAATKKAALLAYGATGGEAALPLLLELAGAQDPKARLEAVEAISRARCEKALEAVTDIVKNDADVRVRKHAQRLLSKMRDDS